MKLAAAEAIAAVIPADHLARDYIVPSVFNRDVAPSVAAAVAAAAERSASHASPNRTRANPGLGRSGMAAVRGTASARDRAAASTLRRIRVYRRHVRLDPDGDRPR